MTPDDTGPGSYFVIFHLLDDIPSSSLYNKGKGTITYFSDTVF